MKKLFSRNYSLYIYVCVQIKIWIKKRQKLTKTFWMIAASMLKQTKYCGKILKIS